jgi:CRISPR-associated protein Cas2
MRLVVLFDLPVAAKVDRQHYARFRKFLVEDGYSMMQFSVYSRVVVGLDGVDTHMKRLKANLPPRGHVRALAVTEKQYATMWFLVGTPTIQEESVGAQLQIWL